MSKKAIRKAARRRAWFAAKLAGTSIPRTCADCGIGDAPGADWYKIGSAPFCGACYWGKARKRGAGL